MIGIILVLVLLVFVGILSNSLNIVAIAGVLTLVSIKYKNAFKKAYIYYIIALIVSVLSMIFYESRYFDLIHFGILGYSFFLTVMLVGVFPNKSIISRSVKRNRGVFSILGFILISPHAFGHIFGLTGDINLWGVAAYVIMVPLTITSFRVIRKEIDPKDWFKIHKAAYAVYLLLFVHLLFVAYETEDKVIYAVLLALYINNKLIKELKKWN